MVHNYRRSSSVEGEKSHAWSVIDLLGQASSRHVATIGNDLIIKHCWIP